LELSNLSMRNHENKHRFSAVETSMFA